VGSLKGIFSAGVHIGRSTSSNVIDSVRIESAYVTSYQSVIITLVPSCLVSKIGLLQVFFCSETYPHPYSIRILRVFPLDQITYVSPSQNLKLISCEVIFEVPKGQKPLF